MPNKDPIKLSLPEEDVVASMEIAFNAGAIITANLSELETKDLADINPYVALFDEEPIDMEDKQTLKTVHRAPVTRSASQPSISELRKQNNSRQDKSRLLSRNIELIPRDVSLYRAQHRG